MYGFGRKNPHNPCVGGFRRERLNEGVYKICNRLPGAIIEVEVNKEQYLKAKSIIEDFNKYQEFYKYNHKGLIYCLLNIEVVRDNHFLCSEFVYYVLNEIGVADLKKSRNLVRPINLLEIEGTMIYKGDLKRFEKNLYFEKIRLKKLEKLKLASVIKINF